MVTCDSRASSDRDGDCRGLYRFHIAARHRGECLSTQRACISCRKPPAAQPSPRPPRMLIVLIAILTVDGFGKIIAAWRRSHPDRFPLVFNGLVDLGCAAVIWYLSRFIGVVQAIGIIVGAYIVAAGWRILMGPVESVASA